MTALIGSGATAIISAMATDAWLWARTEISKVLARNDESAEQDEVARLDAFAADLAVLAERDVHNRLHGYLEARIGDDPILRQQFLTLVRKICIELGLEPPATRITQNANAAGGIVVQTAGGDAHVQVVANQPVMIRWAAMTGPEAGRRLEELDLADAVEALTDMEPALAARRLSHVRPESAQDMLSHMDEGLAAELLAKMTSTERAADLLGRIEPSRAAAILDLAVADWAVARLAEMDPDRALVLLASMGSKRTENLLEAMERQQTVRLLGALSKVLAEQARVRTTFDLAQQEAKHIAAQARMQAEETIASANAEAESIRADALTVNPASRIGAHRAVDQPTALIPLAPSNGAAGPRPAGGTTYVAGQFNGKSAAPGPRLTLPLDYLLLSHPKEGRPKIDQPLLEIAVYGAALCEMVRAGWVSLADGCPVPSRQAECEDPIGGLILQDLRANPRRSFESCVRGLRRELFLRVMQRLIDDGTVVPAPKARLFGRPIVFYKVLDDAKANEPGARLARHLVNEADPPDERTYLLAAFVDVTQSFRQLPIDLREREIRELVQRLLGTRKLSGGLAAVLDGVDRAIATLALTPRVR